MTQNPCPKKKQQLWDNVLNISQDAIKIAIESQENDSSDSDHDNDEK